MPGKETREEAESGRRFSQRVAAARAKAAALAETRAAIFREELSDKGAFAARAVAGFAAAAFFAALALLLATALLAALLSKLLGGAIAGVSATLVLYLAIAAAGAIFGARALDRVKPLDFPATRTELGRDFDALAAAAAAPPEPEDEDDGDEADFEERFRTGSE
ncbi:MAG: phage holin family protein [Thermoanaerobaculia bacterium]